MEPAATITATERERLLTEVLGLSLFLFFAQIFLINFWENRNSPVSPLTQNTVNQNDAALLGEATESAANSRPEGSNSVDPFVASNATSGLVSVTEEEREPETEVSEENALNLSNQANKTNETNETNSSPPTTTPPPPPANSTPNRGRINFPNNKFGVYAYAGADQVELAAELINSHSGDWGWILMPMDINERDSANWNGIFAKALEKHLIPIIQISKANINTQIPTGGEIDGIAEFLAGLGWPTKIRAVTLFNEVNASEYWGGKIDPEGYARLLDHATDKFKSLSGEFFVMNGAFNSSAHDTCTPTDLGGYSCYIGLDTFMRRMNNAVPGIFAKLDGWANHSYPHPSYGGTPWDNDGSRDQGRLTIRAYRYDLRLLAQYGVSLPVFITETGWPHREGNQTCPANITCYDQNTIAQYYKAAFTDYWLKDPAVVAVTPFQLRRDDFDNFAFVAADGAKFPQWEAITSIPKVSGQPPANQ